MEEEEALDSLKRKTPVELATGLVCKAIRDSKLEGLLSWIG
jgi:hypothetical protein